MKSPKCKHVIKSPLCFVNNSKEQANLKKKNCDNRTTFRLAQ